MPEGSVIGDGELAANAVVAISRIDTMLIMGEGNSYCM